MAHYRLRDVVRHATAIFFLFFCACCCSTAQGQSSYTLTTTTWPAAVLTPSNTITSDAAPIATIENSGKVTMVPFLSMNLNRSGTAEDTVIGPYTNSGGFSYNADDEASTNYPQGTSTSSDSMSAIGESGTGTMNGYYWLVQTWDTPNNAFLSMMLYNLEQEQYRWIEMVTPVTSTNEIGADFQATPRHGDGLVWVGHYLYVADSCHGFMVFDTNHVWGIASYNGVDGYDSTEHVFHSNGRAYAMPLIGYYRFANGWTCPTGFNALAGASLHYGYGSQSHLMAWTLDGEIVEWPIDPSTGLLVTDANNEVQPTAGWQVSVGTTQRLFATTAVGSSLYTAFQGTNDACTVDGTLSKFPLTGGTDSSPTPMNGCPEAMVNSWYWNQIWFDTENPHHKMTWAIRPPS
jgi:hypothetical protein